MFGSTGSLHVVSTLVLDIEVKVKVKVLPNRPWLPCASFRYEGGPATATTPYRSPPLKFVPTKRAPVALWRRLELTRIRTTAVRVICACATTVGYSTVNHHGEPVVLNNTRDLANSMLVPRKTSALRVAAPTDPTTSTSFVSDSTNTSADLSDPVAQRDAPDVETGENSESVSISKAEATRPPPRDRYQHCTFCSVCRKDRTDSKAVAKCEACPRILCRKCARREGETVLKAKYADDVVLPLRKCRCQTKDLEFPKPKKGKDPQAHLLKHLLWHDLSVMFREPVNVEENPGYLGVVPREEMMDLGTMKKRLNKGQYHTPRGQKKFRTDLEKIWVNCWKFAGYKPGSSDDRAGIVTCTLILEAMIERFYADYMERQEELAVDGGSWQADWERRKREQFARIAHTPLNPTCGSCADQLDPVDGTDEETDSDDENMRIGDSICHKRKFGSDSSEGQAALNTTAHASTAAPLVDGAGSSTGGRVACNVEGLDQNMCALAAIGKTLGDSSSKR